MPFNFPADQRNKQESLVNNQKHMTPYVPATLGILTVGVQGEDFQDVPC
jgi:hypothetical protein